VPNAATRSLLIQESSLKEPEVFVSHVAAHDLFDSTRRALHHARWA
jgi:hypothetical protein